MDTVRVRTFDETTRTWYMRNPKENPQVGDGATFGYGSDRYPATVVEVKNNGKTVGIVPDKIEHKDGQQVFTPCDTPAYRYYSLRQNGKWVLVGDDMKTGGRLSLGFKDYNRDPHF